MKRKDMRVLGLVLVAGLGVAAAGCSSTSAPAASATATATSSAVSTLTVSGAVSLTLRVSDASCTSQQNGAAGWEISGQGVSSSSGQTEPWSLTEYPNTSPAELRLELPDGSQYDSDATSAPAVASVTASSITLSATALYVNGDASANKVAVSGIVPCTK